MSAGSQFYLLASGAIAHMDMLLVLRDRISEIGWLVHVYQDMMVPSAHVDTFTCWLRTPLTSMQTFTGLETVAPSAGSVIFTEPN